MLFFLVCQTYLEGLAGKNGTHTPVAGPNYHSLNAKLSTQDRRSSLWALTQILGVPQPEPPESHFVKGAVATARFRTGALPAGPKGGHHLCHQLCLFTQEKGSFKPTTQQENHLNYESYWRMKWPAVRWGFHSLGRNFIRSHSEKLCSPVR